MKLPSGRKVGGQRVTTGEGNTEMSGRGSPLCSQCFSCARRAASPLCAVPLSIKTFVISEDVFRPPLEFVHPKIRRNELHNCSQTNVSSTEGNWTSLAMNSLQCFFSFTTSWMFSSAVTDSFYKPKFCLFKTAHKTIELWTKAAFSPHVAFLNVEPVEATAWWP